MSAPYNPNSVANLYVERSLKEALPIDHMKLQKLVYFSHGYYLAATKLERGSPTPLVNQFFEAWQYGPVCTSVYHCFKDFGKNAITSPALEYNPNFGAAVLVPPPSGDELLASVSEYVWKQYAAKPSMQLSDITHRLNGAWDKARKSAPGIRGPDISNDLILEDFQSLVKKKDA